MKQINTSPPIFLLHCHMALFSQGGKVKTNQIQNPSILSMAVGFL
jgi:hypothetical protein